LARQSLRKDSLPPLEELPTLVGQRPQVVAVVLVVQVMTARQKETD
jgi:hypothetical protein